MRDISDFTILVLPGVNGSGAGHFQAAWEEAFPEFQRVEQADWDHPVYADWSARLTAAVADRPRNWASGRAACCGSGSSWRRLRRASSTPRRRGPASLNVPDAALDSGGQRFGRVRPNFHFGRGRDARHCLLKARHVRVLALPDHLRQIVARRDQT